MIDVTLDKYIKKMSKRLFKWGKLDCVLFACDWCEYYVGINPAEGAHGQYNDEESAFKYLKKEYGSVSDGMNKHFSRVEPKFRQKGDVALCMLNDDEVLGVCGAGGFVFFKSTKKGIVGKREPEIIAAWRVE